LVGFFIVLIAGICSRSASGAQIPPGAVECVNRVVTFKGQPQPLRATFYILQGDPAGVVVSRLNGEEIARGQLDNATLRCAQATGVFDLTGDGPELVLIGQVGAKTLEAKIFRLEDHKLVKIFEWSGWNIKVVRLADRSVIAVLPLQYGSLTDLYVWEDGKFREADDRFSGYYATEIETQRKILNTPQGLPIYEIPQACYLGARALVYGKRYGDAKELCAKAMDVARREPSLVPSFTQASSQEVTQERTAAEESIHKTLQDIAKAEKQGKTRLPEQNPQSFRGPFKAN
jgi:hypothetical protein